MAGWRVGHTRIPSCTPGCPHAHHDSDLCCWRKTDPFAALQGGWAFAFAFRREVLASLDVAYTAATTLPPRRRGLCCMSFYLSHGLLLCCKRTFERNTLRMHLRVAGGCVAPITQEAQLALYDLCKISTPTAQIFVSSALCHRACLSLLSQLFFRLQSSCNALTSRTRVAQAQHEALRIVSCPKSSHLIAQCHTLHLTRASHRQLARALFPDTTYFTFLGSYSR